MLFISHFMQLFLIKLFTGIIVICYSQDLKTWEPKRIAALISYIFIAVVSCQRIYVVIRAPLQDRQRKELTEAYMEAVIPEPSPSNVRK